MAARYHQLDDKFLTEQIRTSLYGDQRISINELQILHTKIFQRLYDLKQLGWTDRIFPDAVHSRFNHSLGTLEQADRIIRWIINNCKGTEKDDLAQEVERNRWVIRFVALIHDIFHIPFGHTLEDELGVLPRHDEDENRKILFLDRLISEIVFWEYNSHCTQALSPTEQNVFWNAYRTGTGLLDITKRLFNILIKCPYNGFQQPDGIKEFLLNFAKAGEALIFMGEYKIYEKKGVRFVWSNFPPIANILVNDATIPFFNPASDLYICDIVGNTICADLLDYGNRDIHCSGLKMQYDSRLLQHFTVIKKSEEMKILNQDKTPPEEYKISIERTHTAIDLIRGRIRYDALTEILQILKIRYSLTERVLFHRTKCAAGAMLGKAVSLLKLTDNEVKEIQLQGDSEFLVWLEGISISRNVDKNEIANASASLKILRELRARRFYKPVYHVHTFPGVMPTDNSHPATILSVYGFRTELENRIEKLLGFAPGSVIIYCPWRTQLKEAKCLVIYDKGGNIKPLCEVPEDSSIGFFAKEASAIEHEYNYGWNMYMFVPQRLLVYWPAIQSCFESEYKKMIPRDKSEEIENISNDRFLVAYLHEVCEKIGLPNIEDDCTSIEDNLGIIKECEFIKNIEDQMFNAHAKRRHGKEDEKMPLLFESSSFIDFFKNELIKKRAEINKILAKSKETI